MPSTSERPSCPDCHEPMVQIATKPQPESEKIKTGKRLYQCTNFGFCNNRLYYNRDGSQYSPNKKTFKK